MPPGFDDSRSSGDCIRRRMRRRQSNSEVKFFYKLGHPWVGSEKYPQKYPLSHCTMWVRLLVTGPPRNVRDQNAAQVWPAYRTRRYCYVKPGAPYPISLLAIFRCQFFASYGNGKFRGWKHERFFLRRPTRQRSALGLCAERYPTGFPFHHAYVVSIWGQARASRFQEKKQSTEQCVRR
jgi:hypothetical protein